MINTLLYRILLAIPTMLGVAVICFMLVQIAPGDPLVSVMPPDASEALRQTLMQAYGFDKPLPLQFVHWLWRALHGDLGMSVATGRPVIGEVMTAVGYSLRLALLATVIGFVLGSLFGFVAGYFRNSLLTVWLRCCRCLASACRITGWGCCWSSSLALSSRCSRRPAAGRLAKWAGSGTGSTCSLCCCRRSRCR